MNYFPLAIMEVSRLSVKGNLKHNPGEPLHWAKEKSNDHADCVARHLLEHDKLDDDGFYHDVKVAWRAMSLLETRLEKGSAPTEPVKAPTTPPIVEEPYSFQTDPGRLCREYMSLLDYLPLGEKLSVPIETINNPAWKNHETTSFSLEHDGIMAILTRIKND